MKATYIDEQVAVFDDVLSPEDFKNFWNYCQNETWESVHAQTRLGVFRLDDGDPLWGKQVAWPSMPLEGMLPPGLDLSKAPLKFYPTRKAIDPVLEAIKARCPHVTSLIGKEGEDWAGISVRPYIYPRGSGVSWHADNGPYSGAVIFYAHPEWNVLWGGELLIADPSTKLVEAPGAGVHQRLDNRAENEEILRNGFGRYVMPKPNRIVFIAPGYRHMIAKVTPAAGNHARVSVAGFFITPEGVMQMAKMFLEQGV
ncbi:2OG-Fe(II) oxygenase [Archangium lipolyticum]|uniref:2OG-Fe(II) oxygenase n=1 Tax=Archangium lipolyticum TaxID=2970465 RepID=UPI00214A7511|nr:2OG-Fe(II) oxygenase [Archangium lipolyticum]